MTEINNVTKKRFFHVGQDWATVIVGFVLIFTVLLAGYNIKVPSFGDKTGWHDFATFLASFSSGSFFISVLGTFLLYLAIATSGAINVDKKNCL
jgi:hypothetical protein